MARTTVELCDADRRTPVTDGVAPPAGKDPSTLPFRARSWPDFERILLQYAEHVDGLRSVRLYGVPGQAQHGIDLYGTDPAGSTVAYQAKNVSRFTAVSLRKAVQRFTDEPPPLLNVRRLVVCTACQTDDAKVGEELAKLRTANPMLEIDLCDERTLSEGLRGRPDLVRRLFGPQWQIAFCDGAAWEVPNRSTTDELADSLVRGPVSALGLNGQVTHARTIAGDSPGEAAELIANSHYTSSTGCSPGSQATKKPSTQLPMPSTSSTRRTSRSISPSSHATHRHRSDRLPQPSPPPRPHPTPKPSAHWQRITTGASAGTSRNFCPGSPQRTQRSPPNSALPFSPTQAGPFENPPLASQHEPKTQSNPAAPTKVPLARPAPHNARPRPQGNPVQKDRRALRLIAVDCAPGSVRASQPKRIA